MNDILSKPECCAREKICVDAVFKSNLHEQKALTEQERADYLKIFQTGWEACWLHMRHHLENKP